MLTDCLFVGLGGALGAVGRYLAGTLPLAPHAVLFLKTGLCGGFTTFSTFSLETVGLLEARRYAAGCSYAALSVGLCLTGILLGRALSGLVLHK